MADEIGFQGRLAYVRWLLDRGRIPRISDAELADWLGVGVKWLGKWKTRTDAPPGVAEAEAIDAAFAKHDWSRRWLYKGTGTPPEPDEWHRWLDALRAGQRASSVEPRAEDVAAARAENQAKRNAVAKRAVGSDRPDPARRPKPR